MKTKKRSLGDLGEGIVCKYLENKGYLVLGRNYWKPWGEIDIIAVKEKKLHFVEVKTVTREPGREVWVRPEENVHHGKIQRLHRVIQTYLLTREGIGESSNDRTEDWQLDLACVYLSLESKSAKVEMIENII